jgi:hypothetical protein
MNVLWKNPFSRAKLAKQSLKPGVTPTYPPNPAQWSTLVFGTPVEDLFISFFFNFLFLFFFFGYFSIFSFFTGYNNT